MTADEATKMAETIARDWFAADVSTLGNQIAITKLAMQMVEIDHAGWKRGAEETFAMAVRRLGSGHA